MAYGVHQFEIVVESGDFTDREIEQIFRETEVTSEDDIRNVVSVLKQHRPKLYKKIESEFHIFEQRN